MVHMKALSVLFNFPYPKIWIHILRYENATFTALWSSVAFLNSAIALQVCDMNFETAKYEHSYPQKVSSEQPFPVAVGFLFPLRGGCEGHRARV